MLAAKLHKDARLVAPTHSRRDARHLVGDPGKLQQHTGWHPIFGLEDTISDLIEDRALIDAQAY
jgi:nucleoside-diphosphate-sugar epimerase